MMSVTMETASQTTKETAKKEQNEQDEIANVATESREEPRALPFGSKHH